MAKRNIALILAAKDTAVEQFLSSTPPGDEYAALTAATDPDRNVVGIGVGRKLRNGRATSTMAIRFYVEHKVPEKSVPKSDAVPDEIDGVPTDVIESGRLFAQATPIARTRLRPAKGGCSIGFEGDGFVMAGTFGCLVTDGRQRYILSNNHVLANENALPLKSPIYQPGLLDGGSTSRDRIASLSRMIELLATPNENRVDCAIAALDKDTLGSPLVLPSVGKLGSATTIPAAERMRVHKHGRTTGYTRGHITDISADVNIHYDFGMARFVDQVIVEGDSGPFSDAGDSGSLIVDRQTNRATALLFAGSASHTIANPIADVLLALGVTLLV